MANGVALRDGKGGARDVRGVNRCARQFLCKRYGDAAGAGADIGDLQAFADERLFAPGAAFADREAIERDFDDVLGFGAGNQDVGCYLTLESPEFLFAGEMLRRLAGGAASEEREEVLGVRAGDLLFGMRVEPGAVAAEGVEQQEFRGEGVGRNVSLAQQREAVLQSRANIKRFTVVEHRWFKVFSSEFLVRGFGPKRPRPDQGTNTGSFGSGRMTKPNSKKSR